MKGRFGALPLTEGNARSLALTLLRKTMPFIARLAVELLYQMLLYHFTHEPGIIGIRKDGFIEPTRPGHPFATAFVCLTSDPDSTGHGLPDGREIPAGHPTELQRFHQNGRAYCPDHTKYRIRILVDASDQNLCSFRKLVPNDQARLGIALSGYFPLGGHIRDEQILNALAAMSRGSIADKAPTWWFYRGRLPSRLISGYEVRGAGGAYEPLGP